MFGNIDWKHDGAVSFFKAILVVFITVGILYFFKVREYPIITTSLILTSIGVFFLPSNPVFSSKCVIMGFVLCFSTTYLFTVVVPRMLPVHYLGDSETVAYVLVFSALFFSIFLMSLFSYINIPACAIIISVIYNGWQFSNMYYIAVFIGSILLLRLLLMPVISNLE